MEAIAEIEDSLGIDNANTIDLSEALSKDQRVNINTQSISGSINLKGLKIDDIVLKKYNETQEEESENIDGIDSDSWVLESSRDTQDKVKDALSTKEEEVAMCSINADGLVPGDQLDS